MDCFPHLLPNSSSSSFCLSFGRWDRHQLRLRAARLRAVFRDAEQLFQMLSPSPKIRDKPGGRAFSMSMSGMQTCENVVTVRCNE